MHSGNAIRVDGSRAGLYSPSIILEGRLLTVARALWLLIAALSLGIYSAALPFHYRQLVETCQGSECHAMQLAQLEAEALQRLGVSLGQYASYHIMLSLILALAYTGVALVIFWCRSRERMALLSALWLVTFGPTAFSTQALAAGQPGLSPLVSFTDQIGWALLLPLFLFTFPDGRFLPRWTQWLFLVFVAVGILGTATRLFFPRLAENETAEQLLWFGLVLTGIGTQVYRFVRVSDRTQRQQTKWVVSGWVVAALGLGAWVVFVETSAPFREPGLPAVIGKVAEVTLVTSMFLVVALAIGFSILRYRLWDVDLIINRTLIWGLLSALVVGVYILVVGTLGALFQSSGTFLPSIVATGLIALLFHPLRQRIQGGVNRLMYGERDEPYTVLSQLGRRLEATLAPGEVLPTIVETVAQTLRLPYVAITRKGGGDFEVAALRGQPVPDSLILPLSFQGEVIGQLICGARSGDRPLNQQERRLLEDIARQAGVALHAQQLAADVQRARERLVVAREEERRRIRRDLHDGLGPALASQTLKIGSARALLRRDSAAADTLLQQLETDSIAALQDIRLLVYNLRPPALDELGLLRALQQDAPRHPGLNISFELPAALPELSAAVEVAIYRIVQEALANAVRHSGASNVTVKLGTGNELRLTIADDGVGMPGAYRPGVGVRSMRERAEELGGTFEVVSGQGAGTSVVVKLPVRHVEA